MNYDQAYAKFKGWSVQNFASTTFSSIDFLKYDILPVISHLDRFNMRVLEVGFGNGSMLASLKSLDFKSIDAIEVNPNLLSLGRKYFTSDRIHGSFDTLHGRFELILVLDVIEHLSIFKGKEMIEHISSRLAPNGVCIIRLPNASSPFAFNEVFGDITHSCFYTPHSVSQLVDSVMPSLRIIYNGHTSGFFRVSGDLRKSLFIRYGAFLFRFFICRIIYSFFALLMGRPISDNLTPQIKLVLVNESI